MSGPFDSILMQFDSNFINYNIRNQSLCSLIKKKYDPFDKSQTVCPRSSDPFYIVTYSKTGHYFLDKQ